jgi:hypothetical protein
VSLHGTKIVVAQKGEHEMVRRRVKGYILVMDKGSKRVDRKVRGNFLLMVIQYHYVAMLMMPMLKAVKDEILILWVIFNLTGHKSLND